LSVVLVGCGSDSSDDSRDAAAPDASAADTVASDAPPPDALQLDGSLIPFDLSGRVVFDWVEAKDDITEGGDRLDYSSIQQRPVRRAIVQAMAGQTAVAEALTDDDGHYVLHVPNGVASVRVQARSRVSAYRPDGIGQEACNGAGWDVQVVDNTMQRALYVLADATPHNQTTTGVDLHATLVYSGGHYGSRAAAPFALLDTVLREIELVCEAVPAVTLPTLYVNWSVNNVPSGNNPAIGQIGTSYFDANQNLFILGKEDVDTDEYDDHVIAHETGHFIEAKLYRSDSIGGTHTFGDLLDPRTAFGEGYGDAISGMVFNDPVYVDTNGLHQASGFSLDVSAAPTANDRGYYSEDSVMYLLWSLYEARDTTPRSGSFDRIHAVLSMIQRTSDASTTLQTFAAGYNHLFGGSAEGLMTRWATDLDMPYAGLCSGSCSGSGDAADVWDTDNDVGMLFAQAAPHQRIYDGSARPAEFWRIYRTLADGANAPTAHDVTVLSNDGNKLGDGRLYRWTAGSSRTATIAVSALVGATCSEDVLDLYVYQAGNGVASNNDTSGCPQVSFAATAGTTYVVELHGYTRSINGWTLTVTQ
jgi:hypothetical protein